jgi:hypothetical protein
VECEHECGKKVFSIASVSFLLWLLSISSEFLGSDSPCKWLIIVQFYETRKLRWKAGCKKLEEQGQGQRWLEAITWVGHDPTWIVASGSAWVSANYVHVFTISRALSHENINVWCFGLGLTNELSNLSVAFYGSRKFITVFTRACLWANQSSPRHAPHLSI